ncbi:MAG: class D beta-lactamase [Candidatus Aminicenantes bacterium]|nr:class D beta-lactamase [Candidatus Aminicenantes bacterium]
MKKLVYGLLIFICFCCVICFAQEVKQASSSGSSAGSAAIPLPENVFQKVFDEFHVKGTFLLYDLNNDTYSVYDKERAEKAFLPASTFKILNSLIALETGAIKDQCETIEWDRRTWRFDEWNQDQTLQSAFRNSVVWAYQELARRIGKKLMQYWVDKADYGNRNISDQIDTFWLEGELRISARQQLEFLKKLYKNQLPFSQRNMDIVKEIMMVEQEGKYILRGKTGWVSRGTPQIGWFVGWLEKANNVYFFALNIDIVNRKDVNARIDVAKEVFKELKLIE